MFQRLKTENIALDRLFAPPYRFTIPAYQRPYSWTSREVGHLLDDVTSAAGVQDDHAASPDYFLGNVLLLDPSDGVRAIDGDRPPFDVVDGQQRIVTLLLLASVLERTVDDRALAARLRGMIEVTGETAPTARITLGEHEQSFVTRHIVTADVGLTLDLDGDAVDLPPLPAAYLYLAREVTSLTAFDRVALARYLIECCHVVVIVTRDIDRAHHMFTVLNDRGRPLQRKDILKAEVLQSLPAERATSALACWDEAQRKLGNDFESLFAHIRTIHASGRPQIISAIRALVKQRTCEAFLADVLVPLADAFCLVRRFGEVEGRAAAHPKLAAALTSLNRFGHSDWVPPALLAMGRFHDDPGFSTRVVIEIDRLMFILKILALGGARRQRRTAQVVRVLTLGAGHEIEAAFAIPREEARTALHHLKDIHRRNPGLAKLILMRLEDELGGAPLLLSTSELSVEHVLPQRPSAASDWRQAFPDTDVREMCTHSLGNLLLIPPRLNERMKNKEFADKRAMLSLHGSSPVPLCLNADVLTASAWTPEAILAREARLLQMLATLWRLEPTNGGGTGRGGPAPGRARERVEGAPV